MRGDESLAVRVIKLSDLDGFAADRIEFLDGFASRPDAQILARYARAHLRGGVASPALVSPSPEPEGRRRHRP
jgi:hypothetical protein